MLKKQGSFILATTLVSALFFSLIGGGWLLFQWFKENDPQITGKPVEFAAADPLSTQTLTPVTANPDHGELIVRIETQQKSLGPSPEEDAWAAGFTLNTIGAKSWTDAEFARLTTLLENNPSIIKHLALEYRINTDPKKARRLAALLGQFDNAIVTEIGVELALSGEISSQKSGLSLLGEQQPHNAKARGAIAELLIAESEPEVLVSALNAMAIPAKTSPTEQQDLLDRISSLANNPDPKVRSHSMSVMSSWAGDANMNHYLIQGLDDSDAHVRKTATYALLKTQHFSDDVKHRLLEKIEDESEEKRTREAALMVLGRFDLTDTEKQRYSQSRKNIRRSGKQQAN